MSESSTVTAEDLSEKTQQLTSDLALMAAASQSPSFGALPITVINKQSSLGRVLADTEYKLAIESKDYQLKLKEPYYIDSIDFIFEDKTDEYELRGLNAVGDSFTVSRPFILGKTARFSVKSIASELTLKGKRALLARRIVTEIKISGSPLSIIEATADALETKLRELKSLHTKASGLVDQVSKEIETLTLHEQRKPEIDAQIEEGETEILRLTGEIKTAQESKEKANKDLINIASRHSQLTTEAGNLANSISQLEQQKEGLNGEIVELKNKLESLTADKNLFTEEIATFNKQSRSQKLLYGLFAAVPIAVIAGLGFHLFMQSRGIAISGLPRDEAINLFIARVPLLLTATAIIWASYSICRSFVKKIMDLDRQQLSFSKLGIIAREVSKSASLGVALSPNEEYERRVLLKMNLIKAHLREELGRAFDYQKEIEKGLDEASLFERILLRTKPRKAPSVDSESGKPAPEDDGDNLQDTHK